jgi:hypothetical protein
MAEIQKPADQVEQKPDASTKKPDNLGKDRPVTADQVAEAEAQRTRKFSTFGDIQAYSDSNPLLIDMGDGTEISSKGQRIAWDPREQLREWGKGLDKTAKQVKQAGAEVSAELTKDGSALDKPSHPYKDNPDQLMDYNACHKAWKHFPIFAKHPNLDPAILPAIIRNEVRSLRLDDKLLWNPSAEHGWGLEKERTIGPANMKTDNIDALVNKYPQLVDPELGGIDPKHPYKSAIKPAGAAWLGAAYLANAAEKLEANGRMNITHRDLIESYNPYADQEFQFKRIHEQLIQIKRAHPLFRDE